MPWRFLYLWQSGWLDWSLRSETVLAPIALRPAVSYGLPWGKGRKTNLRPTIAPPYEHSIMVCHFSDTPNVTLSFVFSRPSEASSLRTFIATIVDSSRSHWTPLEEYVCDVLRITDIKVRFQIFYKNLSTRDIQHLPLRMPPSIERNEIEISS